MLNFGVIAPLLISFVISAAAGPKIIGILRRLKAGQTVKKGSRSAPIWFTVLLYFCGD
mgnify:FL=1